MRARWVIVATILALTTALVPHVAAAQSGGSPDSDVGITADTIKVAVIADGDNPVRPGVFQGSVDGAEAAAEYINDHGGLAGRQIEVEFLDSRLSQDEARSSLIRACEEAFAIVGTTALFLNNIDPMVECPDKQGEATGLPDIPNLQVEQAHQCSPVSFPIVPVGIHCDTVDDAMPTFDVRVGPQEYYRRKFGDLSAVYVPESTLKSTLNAYLPTITAGDELGIENDGTFPATALGTQSSYTPTVQAAKQAGSNMFGLGIDYKSTVQIRNEAAIQGLTDVDVWDCTLACYDLRLIEEGGENVEGQYTSVFFPPFEETKYNKEVARFVKAVGGRENADAFGAQSWAAMRFFEEVVNTIVEADGENGITRARFLEEARKVHDFTAKGMLGPTDIGSNKLNGCFVLLQVKNGKWTRVFPKKKGTLNCATKPIQVQTALD
jgi:ABC-type branched-subunit amino acid transport system substrate-binding protein